MRIGPLRHRVTLQSQSVTQSATGAITKTWSDVATVWAQINPQSGKQFFEQVTNHEEVYSRIIIRYGTNVNSIDNTWRVKYGTRIFEIEAVINWDEKDRMFTLAVREGPKDDE